MVRYSGVLRCGWGMVNIGVGLGVLMLALVGCHDAHRDNPFDPVLTPAVELISVVVDITTGTATLQWTPYVGPQPFAAYWVLRRQKELIAVDTLDAIQDVHRVTFRDTTLAPDLEYVYWITVVNQGGLEVPSDPVRVVSFSVQGSSLLDAHPDSLRGTVSLRWECYRGAHFERYEVRRRRLGEEHTKVLATLTELADTIWVDTTAVPETYYLYSVATFAAGQERVSKEVEARCRLPSVELLQAELTSETATAELAWTAYQGPKFGAYEVRRQAGGLAEQTVAELEDVGSTTYTDMLLDGNTEYVYCICVRTTWEGVGVCSNKRRGIFYSLHDVRPLLTYGSLQAVGLALDEQDGLYVAATTWISTIRAWVMEKGIWMVFPGQTISLRACFVDVLPDYRSPIHVAAGNGKVYVSVAAENDRTLVGTLDEDGQELWEEWVDTDGAFPAGLHLEENGDVLMVDTQGWLYRFSAEGVLQVLRDDPDRTLIAGLILPLRQVVVGPGADVGGNDQFFLLAPQHPEHHVLGRTRISRSLFGRLSTLDEGVGLENGQSLNPVALGFDRQRSRLLVLEAHGRLQVFDATSEHVSRRYITKWGRFGSGDGEFLVSLPISVAMVVDSEGMIYVVDGSGRIQVFVP